ncbi:MAG TPA: electron transport complex subunit RsxG [Pseudomonas sp.]|jgi:electron transport complex protein RnfG|uniref:electron transport complex subunit RsxG n=1 Tax=Pseudomonas sp. TaxID=306 RepID=UPI002ED9F39F
MNAEQTQSANPAREPTLLERWRTRLAYQGASLAVVCALVALALLITDVSTRDSILSEQQEDRLAVLRQVLPAALYDNNPLQDAFHVTDESLGDVEVFPARLKGELSAVALSVSTVGYGGPITQLIAIARDGKILGVRVLTHKETPGLADRIDVAKSDWITRFDGLSLANTPLKAWAVKKDGGQFDQFSGATITPRAVVKGILQALEFQQRQLDRLKQMPVQTTKEPQS